MRVVEAAHRRTVRVAVAIGEAVVVHMMAGPPEWPLLHRGRAHQRPQEARAAVHLERTVRVVAMEREREADGAKKVRHGPEQHQPPREGHDEHQQG